MGDSKVRLLPVPVISQPDDNLQLLCRAAKMETRKLHCYLIGPPLLTQPHGTPITDEGARTTQRGVGVGEGAGKTLTSSGLLLGFVPQGDLRGEEEGALESVSATGDIINSL